MVYQFQSIETDIMLRYFTSLVHSSSLLWQLEEPIPSILDALESAVDTPDDMDIIIDVDEGELETLRVDISILKAG